MQRAFRRRGELLAFPTAVEDDPLAKGLFPAGGPDVTGGQLVRERGGGAACSRPGPGVWPVASGPRLRERPSDAPGGCRAAGCALGRGAGTDPPGRWVFLGLVVGAAGRNLVIRGFGLCVWIQAPRPDTESGAALLVTVVACRKDTLGCHRDAGVLCLGQSRRAPGDV